MKVLQTLLLRPPSGETETPTVVVVVKNPLSAELYAGGRLRFAGLKGSKTRIGVPKQDVSGLSKKTWEQCCRVQCRTPLCPQWNPTVPQSTVPITAKSANSGLARLPLPTTGRLTLQQVSDNLEDAQRTRSQARRGKRPAVKVIGERLSTPRPRGFRVQKRLERFLESSTTSESAGKCRGLAGEGARARLVLLSSGRVS